jgi:hypothetical protein
MAIFIYSELLLSNVACVGETFNLEHPSLPEFTLPLREDESKLGDSK